MDDQEDGYHGSAKTLEAAVLNALEKVPGRGQPSPAKHAEVVRITVQSGGIVGTLFHVALRSLQD